MVRLKQYCDLVGVTDRYTGYRNNLNRGNRDPINLAFSWFDPSTKHPSTHIKLRAEADKVHHRLECLGKYSSCTHLVLHCCFLIQMAKVDVLVHTHNTRSSYLFGINANNMCKIQCQNSVLFFTRSILSTKTIYWTKSTSLCCFTKTWTSSIKTIQGRAPAPCRALGSCLFCLMGGVGSNL